MQFKIMYMTQRHDSALGLFSLGFFLIIETRLQFHIYMYMALKQIKKNKNKTNPQKTSILHSIL